jgi:hypothetical protein
MADTSDLILALTAKVVAACLRANVVACAVVPNLIKNVQRVLRDLSSLGLGERELQSSERQVASPLIDIKRSVFATHLEKRLWYRVPAITWRLARLDDQGPRGQWGMRRIIRW